MAAGTGGLMGLTEGAAATDEDEADEEEEHETDGSGAANRDDEDEGKPGAEEDEDEDEDEEDEEDDEDAGTAAAATGAPSSTTVVGASHPMKCAPAESSVANGSSGWSMCAVLSEAPTVLLPRPRTEPT